MKNKYMLFLLVSLTCLGSMPVQATKSVGYWYNSSGNIVRSSVGECVRSMQWSPSNALAECEDGITKKVAKVVTDSDNDGVLDDKDQCNDTVVGASVDANGCELVAKVEEADSDNDLVADSKDQCKDTVTGANVDANGCEIVVKEADTDNDGIADARDDCLGTADGVVVNAQGCVLQADISLANIQFKTGIAKLNANSQNILAGIAQTLQENQHLRFEVAGHTDNTGPVQYNVDLSSNRAQSVRQYLIDKGVAADRLTARAYGQDKPIASNETREGRKQNRRVELARQ